MRVHWGPQNGDFVLRVGDDVRRWQPGRHLELLGISRKWEAGRSGDPVLERVSADKRAFFAAEARLWILGRL